jgi:hypothetical protein
VPNPIEDALAGVLYRATNDWFYKVDADRSMSPRWFALSEERKEPFRSFAREILRHEGFLGSPS